MLRFTQSKIPAPVCPRGRVQQGPSSSSACPGKSSVPKPQPQSRFNSPGANLQSRTAVEYDDVPVYFSAKTANAKPKVLSGKVAVTVLTTPGDRSLAEVFHNY